jgi:hypothetical protein
MMAAGLALLSGAAITPPVLAAESNHTGTVQSSRLYTAPDAAAGGGIRGKVVLVDAPLLFAFALPTDEPSRVYKGTVQSNAHAFGFQGLPTARYDLLLVFNDSFCEGLTLNRGDNTLTDRDRDLIQKKLMASASFFETKEVHRCEGTTGREGKARCMLQEMRMRPITLQDATVHKEIQIRSLKLALLEDVGPAGWHLVQTREILRQEVGGNERKGVLPHTYSAALSGVRVVDTVKDLGDIKL